MIHPRGRPIPVNPEKSHFTINRANAAALEYLEHQQQAKEWMEEVLGERIENNDLSEGLKDGVVLCKLISMLHPGAEIKVITSTPHAFRTLDNIHAFLEGCRTFGLREIEIFAPPDLFEKKSMPKVIHTLRKLAELAGNKGFGKFKPPKRTNFSNTEIQAASRLPGVSQTPAPKLDDTIGGLKPRGGLVDRTRPGRESTSPPKVVLEPEPVVEASSSPVFTDIRFNVEFEGKILEVFFPYREDMLISELTDLIKAAIPDGGPDLILILKKGSNSLSPTDTISSAGFSPNLGAINISAFRSPSSKKFKNTGISSNSRPSSSGSSSDSDSNIGDSKRGSRGSDSSDAETMENLLKKMETLVKAKDDGTTPLHLAAKTGHTGVVDAMIQRGYDPNAQDREGNTPLHLAAALGHEKTVRKLLVNEKTNINTLNRAGSSALQAATEANNPEIVRLMARDFHANVNTQRIDDGWSPLYTASYNGNKKTVDILLGSGGDPNLQNLEGWTALHAAAHQGHLSIVKALVNQKVEVNAQSHQGTTPLFHAVESGWMDIISFLAEEASADIHLGKPNGWRPLHMACFKGYNDIAEYLVEHGARLDDQINDEELKGYTPLHIIVSTDRLSSESKKNLILLMTKGANLAARDARGATPLHLVAYWDNVEAAATMMRFVDETNIQLLSLKDSNKETPIEVAAYYGNAKVVEILAQKAALDPSSISIQQKPQITVRMKGPNAPPPPDKVSK